MPTKTKKAKINPKLAKAMHDIQTKYQKRMKRYDNLPTLRDVLNRVKNKCNLIVYEGQRYWTVEPGPVGMAATEMDDWRFEVTKHELRLMEGMYDNDETCAFPLSQPVKVGKKSIKLVEDDVELRLLTVTDTNL